MPFLSIEKQENTLLNKENNEYLEIFTTRIKLSLVKGEGGGSQSPVCEFINGLKDPDLKILLGQTLLLYAFFSANYLLFSGKLFGKRGEDFFDDITAEMGTDWKFFLRGIVKDFLESDNASPFKNVDGYHLLKEAMHQLENKECFNMNIVPSKEFLKKIEESQEIGILDTYISVMFFGLNVKDKNTSESMVFWETAAQNFVRRGLLKNGIDFYSAKSNLLSNFAVEHMLSYLEKGKYLDESFLMWKNILRELGENTFSTNSWINKGFMNCAKNYVNKNMISAEEIVDVLFNVPLRNRSYYDLKKNMYILDIAYIGFLGDSFEIIKKDIKSDFLNQFNEFPNNYGLIEMENVLNILEKVLKEVYGKRVLLLNEQNLRNEKDKKNKASLKMLVSDTNDEEVHHVLDSIVKYMWKNKVDLNLFKDEICAVISNAQMSWDMKDIYLNMKNGQKPRKF